VERVESSPEEPKVVLVFRGFGGPHKTKRSADCVVWVEHLSTSHVLHIAALLILNNALIILHDKLKLFPEKKIRTTDVEKLVLVSVWDYNSTTVAHDTHQTSL
jgi:hypothetical protein